MKYKKKHSAFIRIYGLTAKEISNQIGYGVGEVYRRHRSGEMVGYVSPAMPDRFDRRLQIIKSNAITRCKCPSVRNTKYYISKGVKYLLSDKSLYKLWIRDKAFKMQKPSLDRIDSNGNYVYGNCRFIEWSNNRKKRWRKPMNKKMSCPKCLSKQILYRVRKDEHWCRVCGYSWSVKK